MSKISAASESLTLCRMGLITHWHSYADQWYFSNCCAGHTCLIKSLAAMEVLGTLDEKAREGKQWWFFNILCRQLQNYIKQEHSSVNNVKPQRQFVDVR
jgi:hypothetical protein